MVFAIIVIYHLLPSLYLVNYVLNIFCWQHLIIFGFFNQIKLNQQMLLRLFTVLTTKNVLKNIATKLSLVTLFFLKTMLQNRDSEREIETS